MMRDLSSLFGRQVLPGKLVGLAPDAIFRKRDDSL